MRLAIFTIFSALSSLSLALPTPSSSSIPPSQDTWYTAPTSFELASPGEVLRVRSAPGNLTTIFNASSAAYNILYRTTNSLCEPTWAVTTLLVPAASSNRSALVSYQIPYNSLDVDAGPSYSLYAPVSSTTELINDDIQTLLSLGWHVSIPDFEGPLAAFGAGVLEGHATLDAVRAVLNTGFGLTSNARYALWGYSGGSIASEWAAELQVQYAPELSFAGAALGGLVPNATDIFFTNSGGLFAGLLPSAMLGLTRQYPAAYNYIVSQLKASGPQNVTGFLAVANETFEQWLETYEYQDIFAYFVNGSGVIDAPVIQNVLNTNGYMGYHGVPQMPLYIYKAVQDEVAPIAGADKLVAEYCGVGANILYERNTIGGHLAEETNGDASALAFLQAVLGGTYQHEGCTIRDVAINVTDSAI